MPRPERRLRSGRSALAVSVYLVGFGLLVLAVSKYYLLPALAARAKADPQTRKVMAAYALLVMALLLLVLLVGLLMTFRIGRFFRPRSIPRAKPTKYVDAWAESGRRLQVPEREEDEEDL